MAREVILAFPDFNKPFHIYTDASDTQLGAVITQEGKPIAFYSKKLNPAQTRYTTMEKELLSICSYMQGVSHDLARPTTSDLHRSWKFDLQAL